MIDIEETAHELKSGYLHLKAEEYQKLLSKKVALLMIELKQHQQFIDRLLDPEGFGFAVTAEVRDQARVLKGLPKVEQPYRTTTANDNLGVFETGFGDAG